MRPVILVDVASGRFPTHGAIGPLAFPGYRIDVQERALWLLASVAGIGLLVLALRGQLDAPTPPVQSAPVEPPGGTFRVAVLNGCGDANVAARMTRKVRSLGIDVIHEGNAASFDYVESLVIDRVGDWEQAAGVARALGIPSTIQQISDDTYLLEEVTVIVGRDYRRLQLLDP